MDQKTTISIEKKEKSAVRRKQDSNTRRRRTVPRVRKDAKEKKEKVEKKERKPPRTKEVKEKKEPPVKAIVEKQIESQKNFKKQQAREILPIHVETVETTDMSDVALMCQLFATRYVQLYPDEFKGIIGNYSATTLCPSELAAYFFLCCVQIATNKKQFSPLENTNNINLNLLKGSTIPSLLGDWMVNYLSSAFDEAPILTRLLVIEDDWAISHTGISSTYANRNFSSLQDKFGLFESRLSCLNVGANPGGLNVFTKYTAATNWTGLYTGQTPFATNSTVLVKYSSFVESCGFIQTSLISSFTNVLSTTSAAFCVLSAPLPASATITWLNATVVLSPNNKFSAAEAIIYQPNYSAVNYPYKTGFVKCAPMPTLYNPTRFNEDGNPIVPITAAAQILQAFTYVGCHANIVPSSNLYYMEKYRIFDCRVPRFDRIQQFHVDYTKFMNMAMKEFVYHCNTGIVSANLTSDSLTVAYWYYDHLFRARIFDIGALDLTASIGAVQNIVTWQNFFSSQSIRNAKVTTLVGMLLEQNGPYVAGDVLFVPSCNFNAGATYNSFPSTTGFKSAPLLPWASTPVSANWKAVGSAAYPGEYPSVFANTTTSVGNVFPNLVSGAPGRLISNSAQLGGQPEGIVFFPNVGQLSQAWYNTVSAYSVVDNANPLINNWFGLVEGIIAAYVGFYGVAQIDKRGKLYPLPRRGLRGGISCLMTAVEIPASEYGGDPIAASAEFYINSNNTGVATSNNEFLTGNVIITEFTISHFVHGDYVASLQSGYVASAVSLRTQAIPTIDRKLLGASAYYYNVPSEQATTIVTNLVNEFNNVDSAVTVQFNKNFEQHMKDFSYNKSLTYGNMIPPNCWKNIISTTANIIGQAVFSPTAASFVAPACKLSSMILRTGLRVPIPTSTCSVVDKAYQHLRGVYTNEKQK